MLTILGKNLLKYPNDLRLKSRDSEETDKTYACVRMVLSKPRPKSISEFCHNCSVLCVGLLQKMSIKQIKMCGCNVPTCRKVQDELTF